MATTEGNRVFVDTNVLVYAAVSQAPFHAEARSVIRTRQEAGMDLWISRQVLREYLATLSRPQTFSIPQPIDVLIADIQRFQASFSIAEDGPAVTAKLLEVLGPSPWAASRFMTQISWPRCLCMTFIRSSRTTQPTTTALPHGSQSCR